MAERFGIVLDNPVRIARARAYLERAAELGWHVEFRAPKRSLEQNARLWELLGRASQRMEIGGRKFAPDEWKCIFMQAMGAEAQFLPSLSGGFFPTGFRSSQMTIREMCDLQTFIEVAAADRGVDLWADVGQ